MGRGLFQIPQFAPPCAGTIFSVGGRLVSRRTRRRGSLAAMLAAIAVSAACGAGAPSYNLTVAFNTTVTQTDMDRVGQLIRRFDSSADMLVTETFPPTGHVTVKTGARDFCREIETALDALPFVANTSCERSGNGGDGSG